MYTITLWYIQFSQGPPQSACETDILSAPCLSGYEHQLSTLEYSIVDEMRTVAVMLCIQSTWISIELLYLFHTDNNNFSNIIPYYSWHTPPSTDVQREPKPKNLPSIVNWRNAFNTDIYIIKMHLHNDKTQHVSTLTSKSHENMIIKDAYLPHSSLLLQLRHWLLLHTQYHYILSLYTNLKHKRYIVITVITKLSNFTNRKPKPG